MHLVTAKQIFFFLLRAQLIIVVTRCMSCNVMLCCHHLSSFQHDICICAPHLTHLLLLNFFIYLILLHLLPWKLTVIMNPVIFQNQGKVYFNYKFLHGNDHVVWQRVELRTWKLRLNSTLGTMVLTRPMMSPANKGKNQRQDQSAEGRGPPTQPIWNREIRNMRGNRD